MRRCSLSRQTNETDIRLTLALDGRGEARIDTGVGFLDHMLELLARHGRLDLEILCRGDLKVDFHHTTEDVGSCLGQAIAEALGDKRGIRRYGSQLLPMDEALALCALDLSGRSCLRFTADFPSQKIGDFDTELVREFFEALSRSAAMTLHLKMLDGFNSHHMAEALFKAFGRALREAVSLDEKFPEDIPSTKGVLS